MKKREPEFLTEYSFLTEISCRTKETFVDG
jgi:hypothetical protein